MTDDSLLYLLRAPAFVEATLRAALIEMLSARRTFGGEFDVRTFIKCALLKSRRTRDAALENADALICHELEAAVVRTAAFFAASPSGRRLCCLPVERIIEPPPNIDAAVYDKKRALHYIRFDTYLRADERFEAATRLIRAMDRSMPERLASLHFFSLRDGRLRSYRATVQHRIVSNGAVARAA